MAQETIVAEATAPGRAGVSVIRVSGREARAVAERLGAVDLRPRYAHLRSLMREGARIDDALVLWFPAPRSFTGEDVVEFHVHGSRAVVRRVIEESCAVADVRLAEPGEFTKRALQNGKLDLTQVEGLADLIEAETEAQRKQAVELMSGSLGQRAESWRGSLVRASALLMAVIDFSDDEVPESVNAEVLGLLRDVKGEIEGALDGAGAAQRVKAGFEVAIVGVPNAGKSTLLNAIADRDVAITSDVAGTTRDVIEVMVDLGGLMVRFLDTAGLRETSDTVEALGVERARVRAEEADLRVYLLAEEGEVPFLELRPGDIAVVGKADTEGPGVSGLTGRGVEELLSEISGELETRVAGASGWSWERHQDHMGEALRSLVGAVELLERDGFPEEGAELIRRSQLALQGLIGVVDVEDVLDDVFSQFCLGK